MKTSTSDWMEFLPPPAHTTALNGWKQDCKFEPKLKLHLTMSWGRYHFYVVFKSTRQSVRKVNCHKRKDSRSHTWSDSFTHIVLNNFYETCSRKKFQFEKHTLRLFCFVHWDRGIQDTGLAAIESGITFDEKV